MGIFLLYYCSLKLEITVKTEMGVAVKHLHNKFSRGQPKNSLYLLSITFLFALNRV